MNFSKSWNHLLSISFQVYFVKVCVQSFWLSHKKIYSFSRKNDYSLLWTLKRGSHYGNLAHYSSEKCKFFTVFLAAFPEKIFVHFLEASLWDQCDVVRSVPNGLIKWQKTRESFLLLFPNVWKKKLWVGFFFRICKELAINKLSVIKNYDLVIFLPDKKLSGKLTLKNEHCLSPTLFFSKDLTLF